MKEEAQAEKGENEKNIRKRVLNPISSGVKKLQILDSERVYLMKH